MARTLQNRNHAIDWTTGMVIGGYDLERLERTVMAFHEHLPKRITRLYGIHVTAFWNADTARGFDLQSGKASKYVLTVVSRNRSHADVRVTFELIGDRLHLSVCPHGRMSRNFKRALKGSDLYDRAGFVKEMLFYRAAAETAGFYFDVLATAC